ARERPRDSRAELDALLVQHTGLGRHARSRSNHRGSLALRPQERSHTAAGARAVASMVTLLGKGMQVVAWRPNDRMKGTAPGSWSAAAYPSVGRTLMHGGEARESSDTDCPDGYERRRS